MQIPAVTGGIQMSSSRQTLVPPAPKNGTFTTLTLSNWTHNHSFVTCEASRFYTSFPINMTALIWYLIVDNKNGKSIYFLGFCCSGCFNDWLHCKTPWHEIGFAPRFDFTIETRSPYTFAHHDCEPKRVVNKINKASWWHISATVNWVNGASAKGMSPVRC